MSIFKPVKFYKEDVLPTGNQLIPNALYFIRVGEEFDLYVTTDTTPAVANKIVPGSSLTIDSALSATQDIIPPHLFFDELYFSGEGTDVDPKSLRVENLPSGGGGGIENIGVRNLLTFTNTKDWYIEGFMLNRYTQSFSFVANIEGYSNLVFSFKTLLTDRLRYGFTTEVPEEGVEVVGSRSLYETGTKPPDGSQYKITVPEGAKWIILNVNVAGGGTTIETVKDCLFKLESGDVATGWIHSKEDLDFVLNPQYVQHIINDDDTISVQFTKWGDGTDIRLEDGDRFKLIVDNASYITERYENGDTIYQLLRVYFEGDQSLSTVWDKGLVNQIRIHPIVASKTNRRIMVLDAQIVNGRLIGTYSLFDGRGKNNSLIETNVFGIDECSEIIKVTLLGSNSKWLQGTIMTLFKMN